MAKRGWNIGLFGEALAVVLALFDSRTRWGARLVAGLVLIYLVSPFDFMPDFIPLIGLLDDVALVPLGLWLASRLIPVEALDTARARIARKKDRAPAK